MNTFDQSALALDRIRVELQTDGDQSQIDGIDGTSEHKSERLKYRWNEKCFITRLRYINREENDVSSELKLFTQPIDSSQALPYFKCSQPVLANLSP